MARWFYASEGKKKGPFTPSQFRALVTQGEVRADTLVWTEGMAAWKKASEIDAALPAEEPAAASLPARGQSVTERAAIDRAAIDRAVTDRAATEQATLAQGARHKTAIPQAVFTATAGPDPRPQPAAPQASRPQETRAQGAKPQTARTQTARPQTARSPAARSARTGEDDRARPTHDDTRLHRPAPLRGSPLSMNIGMFNLLWRGIVFGLGVSLIIPAPWAAVWFWKWTVSRVVVPGHRAPGFIGEVTDIWYVFMGFGALNYVRWIGLFVNNMTLTWSIVIAVACLLLQFMLAWMMLRWLVSNLVASYERLAITFTGNPITMMGWFILMILPIPAIGGLVWGAVSLSGGSITSASGDRDTVLIVLLLATMLIIIAWAAWVAVGMIHWVCRNIEGTRRQVIFVSSWLQVLWRSLLFSFGCSLLIPIPAMLRWYVRWFVSQFYLVSREEPEAG